MTKNAMLVKLNEFTESHQVTPKLNKHPQPPWPCAKSEKVQTISNSIQMHSMNIQYNIIV